MPAPGQTVAQGEPARILEFLADHSDTGYRPAEVARELYADLPKSGATMRAGTQLARLARGGRVLREVSDDGRTVYRHKPN